MIGLLIGSVAEFAYLDADLLDKLLDAGSGKVIFRGRLGALGAYFSSPVAAGGRIYFASEAGIVSVIGSGDRLDVLARNDLEEPVFATPAIVESVIYIRTPGHVYAFGK